MLAIIIWLTIANLESENICKVYDFLSYPKGSLVRFFQNILPDEENVVLSLENVQQQVGDHDCRFFALAFITFFCYEDILSRSEIFTPSLCALH